MISECMSFTKYPNWRLVINMTVHDTCIFTEMDHNKPDRHWYIVWMGWDIIDSDLRTDYNTSYQNRFIHSFIQADERNITVKKIEWNVCGFYLTEFVLFLWSQTRQYNNNILATYSYFKTKYQYLWSSEPWYMFAHCMDWK